MDSSGTTEIGERMAAMVRMYDLTHDTRYLDHLFDLIEIVLRYRDDRPLGSGPKVTDEIRNKVGLRRLGGRVARQLWIAQRPGVDIKPLRLSDRGLRPHLGGRSGGTCALSM